MYAWRTVTGNSEAAHADANYQQNDGVRATPDDGETQHAETLHAEPCGTGTQQQFGPRQLSAYSYMYVHTHIAASD